MGGFFGAASNNDCITDVFFGTDYHSHLGTRRGGMTAYSPDRGFQRAIHSIENSPFRTKFEQDATDMRGKLCIGCISDTDPQPLLVRSKLGMQCRHNQKRRTAFNRAARERLRKL